MAGRRGELSLAAGRSTAASAMLLLLMWPLKLLLLVIIVLLLASSNGSDGSRLLSCLKCHVMIFVAWSNESLRICYRMIFLSDVWYPVVCSTILKVPSHQFRST